MKKEYDINYFSLFDYENNNFLVKLIEKNYSYHGVNEQTAIMLEMEVKGVASKFYIEIPLSDYYLFKEWKEASERVVFYLKAYKEQYNITDAVFNDIINSVEDDTLPFVLELIEREEEIGGLEAWEAWEAYLEEWNDWVASEEDDDDDLADPVV